MFLYKSQEHYLCHLQSEVVYVEQEGYVCKESLDINRDKLQIYTQTGANSDIVSYPYFQSNSLFKRLMII